MYMYTFIHICMYVCICIVFNQYTGPVGVVCICIAYTVYSSITVYSVCIECVAVFIKTWYCRKPYKNLQCCNRNVTVLTKVALDFCRMGLYSFTPALKHFYFNHFVKYLLYPSRLPHRCILERSAVTIIPLNAVIQQPLSKKVFHNTLLSASNARLQKQHGH